MRQLSVTIWGRLKLQEFIGMYATPFCSWVFIGTINVGLCCIILRVSKKSA